MQIEVDQSGKIEQTSLDTVIALTNGVKYTLLFKKKDKREVEKYSREIGFKKLYPIIIFANLVAMVIKNSKATKAVLIDTEYHGHNNFIEKIIQSRLKAKCPKLRFGYVGKESNSDTLARKVANKKVMPNLVINSKEVIKISYGNKKKSGNI
jgi:adenosine/AMP kinase